MDQLKQQLSLPPEFQLKKRLRLIFEKKWMVIGLLVFGILSSLVISLLLPKQYRASSRINFRYNSVYNILLSNSGSLENEMSHITSKKVLSNTIERLSKENINLSVSDLLNMINLFEDKASTSIIISSVGDDAERVSGIVNMVMSSFYEESLLNSRGPYLSTLKLLDVRSKEIQSLNMALKASQQTRSISSLSVNEEQIITRLSEFESELENIEIDNQYYSVQIQFLQKVLKDAYPVFSTQVLNIIDPEIDDYKLRIERLETKKSLSTSLQKLRNFRISYPWSDNYRIEDLPKIKTEFNKKLSNYVENLAEKNNTTGLIFLRKLVAKYYDSQIMASSIDLSKSVIFNVMTDLESQFNRIPFANLDNARQVRLTRFQNKLLVKLKSKELKLKEKQKNYFTEIESTIKAEVPNSFFSPNIPLNLFIGGLLGLIVGVILAMTSKKEQIEFVTRTNDLEKAGYKIISQIPTIPSDTMLMLDSLNDSEKNNPNIVKSFEGIYTFLKYGNLEKPLRTILITSGYEDEGKSVIASNIAITLAKQSKKVLLVDADLKNPKLNKYFKIKSTPSLAHYLFRKKELEEIIRSTHYKNLDLITCIEFPQNPSVIITSERMKNFMDSVKTDYDYVVYDTSSLCKLKETTSMAKRVDEVILVVRANKTRFSELSKTEVMLQEAGITNFNVVLNDINI